MTDANREALPGLEERVTRTGSFTLYGDPAIVGL